MVQNVRVKVPKKNITFKCTTSYDAHERSCSFVCHRWGSFRTHILWRISPLKSQMIRQRCPIYQERARQEKDVSLYDDSSQDAFRSVPNAADRKVAYHTMLNLEFLEVARCTNHCKTIGPKKIEKPSNS